MTIITRFAPSPTGYLHVGNVRTALVNWLYTKSKNGKFMLRMDDTDPVRSKQEYADAIIEDLKWLGLHWDIFAKQSDRLERYNQIKEQLIANGRLYACFETQEELEVKRKMQLKRGLPPIYDRAALKLTDDQKQKFEQEGKKPHYRFLLQDSPIIWNDEVRGVTQFEGKNLSDPIIIREDGTMTYILTSVVDDIDFAITNIIRGEDHVSNTAIQIQIFEALNSKPPVFAHLALIKAKDAEISKRTGGFDIRSVRNDHIEAMSINNLFAKIGTSEAINNHPSLDLLTQEFDISKFSRAPATYDPDDLVRINHKLVASMDYNEAKPKLDNLNMNIEEEFWNHIKNNISKINEATLWFNICKKDISPIIDDKELLELAMNSIPEEPWNETTWNKWIELIKPSTNKKGKDLFMPIRKALTGIDHGPELKYLLPLIGRSKCLRRLKGEIA